ncbi:hypothetical protein FNF31_00021 [Cafeteria roenbergensis]|uniref:RNA helicase n=2 Tax=Cafeteria roenbergensis TaxID=33653 RepID=A0A5A8DYI4_CAFRO|nr:hypothetical protein FNF31_00021 [Cafeteria roenbergensis]KAA0170610.1 hypothetical protein FNF28_01372 [Cafeteria roenbergensis]
MAAEAVPASAVAVRGAVAGVLNAKYLDNKAAFTDAELGLDRRLVAAVQQMGYVTPTLVQSKAIPLALEGRDLLVRAKTGSGKTAAYALAALQRVLARTQDGAAAASAGGGAPRVLVLVPTRELTAQTASVFEALAFFCRDVVSVASLASGSDESQAAALARDPDVLVGTPARVMAHLAAGKLVLDRLEQLIVDEADLVLSYGHGDDVKGVVRRLPRAVQTLLLSATLPQQLEDMRRVVLHSPAVLRLEDGASSTDGTLTQWVVEVGEEDRYLLLYALVKLRLVSGRAIFFVNDLDSCYRLKLFLEAFGIRAAVLNAELPANSRAHVLRQFHQGVFDYLIATDESLGVDAEDSDGEGGAEEALEEDDAEGDLIREGLGEVARAAAARDAEDEDEDEDDDDDDDDDEEEEEEDDDDEDEEDPQDEEDDDADDESADDSEEDDEEDDEEEGGDDDDEEGAKKRVAAAAAPRKRAREERSAAGEKAAKRERPSAEAVAIARRSARRQQRLRRLRADIEYGVARGVDFRGVGTVVNVDFPRTLHAYVHRIGRTARGGASGASLSFMRPGDAAAASIVERARATQAPAADGAPQPALLPFDKNEVTGFRYRVQQVLQSLRGRKVIREARAAELKNEMLNSERLKAHFEDNPDDLRVLRHDGPLLPSRVRPELATVPAYLLPNSVKAAAEAAAADSQAKRAGAASGGRKGAQGGQDPLKAYSKHAARMGVGAGTTLKVGPGAFTIGGGRAGAGASKAGRVQWKMRHRKGKFAKRASKGDRPF